MMWVHLAGQPAPIKLRTVDMPRREIAASRERAARLKALVYQMQAADQGPDQPAALPAPRGEARFEWAGRDETSAGSER